MEIKWLKDYVALIEYGSFSKAAEARCVTQPAFSRRIRSLENWLGVCLINRNKFPTTPTPAGKAFAEKAKQLIGQMYAVRNQMSDISVARAQLLIISQHALAVSFFPSWMETLESIAEGALIKVETGNLHDSLDDFLSGNGDFLLCYSSSQIYSQLQRADVESLPVGKDTLIPVSAVDTQGNPLFTLEEGKPLKLLSHPSDSFFGHLLQQECLSRLPANSKINLICENALSEALKALVLKGHGMAWLPKSLINDELKSGKLHLLDSTMHTVELNIKMFRLIQSRSLAAEKFWDYLKELYTDTFSAV